MHGQRRFSAAAIPMVLAGLLLSACSPTSALPPDWRLQSADGVELGVPPDWRATVDADQGAIRLAGPAGERALVWPVFVRTELKPELANRIVAQLSRRVAPDFAWTPAAAATPRTVRLAGRDGEDRIAVSALCWVSGSGASAGTFACLSAPEPVYRTAEETFAAILSSLRLRGPAPSEPRTDAPELKYVRWHDPQERAFELDVPEGWKVTGGLSRHAAVDTRPAVEARSPDGRMAVYFGDADTSAFVVPSPMLEAAGLPEGKWYTPGYGVLMQVKRYMTGGEFAHWFVTTRLAHNKRSLKLAAVRSRPDVDREMNEVFRRLSSAAVRQDLASGEVAYTCRDNRGDLAGYTFAATLRTESPNGLGSLWTVERNFGYLATADRAAMAESVLQRMVASFRLNETWIAKQTHVAAETSDIVAETGAQVSRLISETYEHRNEARAEGLRRLSNAILEVEDTVDPRTGEAYRVESGANYYWIDPRGNIVGTETYGAPAIDFRELVRLP